MNLANKKKLIVDLVPWLIILLALWSLRNASPPLFFADKFNLISNWKNTYPSQFLFLFLVTHFICSQLGIPGGCTLLNISAGAIWGVALSALILFPITLLSLIFGYCIGLTIHNKKIIWIENWRAKLKTTQSSPLLPWLIAMRLSPLLPFNLLNIFLGAIKIPFQAYFISGLIGISIDVFFLSSIGHAYHKKESYNSTQFIISCLALVILMVFLRSIFRAKTQNYK